MPLPALSLLLVGAGIWLFAAKYNHNVNTTINVYALNPGTPLATQVICLESDNPGPCILIVGGIHGDEPAGVQAGTELAESLTPHRGRLVLIPNANPPAVAAQKRFVSGESDLNRAFGLGRTGVETGKQAEALWSLLMEERVDWVIDLHEARSLYSEEETTVGQTLIFSPAPAAAVLVLKVLDTINHQLAPDLTFTYLSPPMAGSLVREAWEQLGIPGLIIETSKGQELADRVAQHRLVVETIMKRLLEE